MQPLSYRLSKGTRIQMHGDRMHLVLRYPLKTMIVHPSWCAVFERLAEPTFVPLSDLTALMAGIRRMKIAIFLDRMVYKGFVDRVGADKLNVYPSFSIIIPVHNRPAEICACLTSLQQLDYPADKLEIIVVDDASDDTTPDEVEMHSVRLIRLEQNKQASYCRNLGARHATGEFLAFIDSDCIADPQWLKSLLPAFNDPHLSAVGGRVDGYYDTKRLDLYEKAKSSLMVSSHAKHSEGYDPFFYVPACNFLVRRLVFLETGGFDINLSVGEDVDLCWRLQKIHHDLEFRPEGIVYHKHRNQVLSFCKRRFNYGTSEPLLQKMHPDKVKQFITPPLTLGFWLFLIFWTLTGNPLFGGGGGLLLVADSLLKNHQYKRLDIGLGLVFSATLRGYAAFGYHLCTFVSRYYIIAGFLCLPLMPIITVVVVFIHLLVGVVEYRLKKTNLSLPWFVVFFTFEQLSYQVGVWWGCLRHRCLSPVLPKPVFVRSPIF